MSQLPDHDRIRRMLKRLTEIQRESEQIRERIANIRRESLEYPDRRQVSRLFDGLPASSSKQSSEGEAGDGNGKY